jgi:DNA-binding transcriptional ArsR family regulator
VLNNDAAIVTDLSQGGSGVTAGPLKPWVRFSNMEQSESPAHVTRARSALADVDTATWSQRFDLLSDPNRLEILLVLHRAPGICVGDLAHVLGRSENAVSQALRVLRRLGWVSATRTGRAVSYQLDDETGHDLLHWIGARRG